MNSIFSSFYQNLIAFGNTLQPFFLLAIRLFWGWQFFKSGLDKLGDIDSIADYFATLGIPFPGINAYLAAGTEMIGGALLFIGLGTRLAALPLIFTMGVALLTAHREATLMLLDDPIKFIAQGPFTFMMACLTLLIFGPGPISVDGVIKKQINSVK